MNLHRAHPGPWGWDLVLECLRPAARRSRAPRLNRVGEWSVACREIRARISGWSGQDAAVVVPCPDWWPPHLDAVARWFVFRPDWSAALRTGLWPADLLEHLASRGRWLLPDAAVAERVAAGARCDQCGERGCPHVTALVQGIAQEVSAQPQRALVYVGLEPEVLFRRVHALSAEWLAANAADAPPHGVGAGPAAEAPPDAPWSADDRAKTPPWAREEDPGVPVEGDAPPLPDARFDTARIRALCARYRAWVWGPSGVADEWADEPADGSAPSGDGG
ncbi:hypothetical protein [Alicyclobacillus sp.]|uniref:hypothetical protein n=1 Tax=Alicyclobacillus sp. TaxID=61169 RepID=UPI0025BF01B2|nr:hypothetical protein [Alicyclobacillus sp.]MCL6518149.1 hypothetical protein [Alicyclobacillus sp.]